MKLKRKVLNNGMTILFEKREIPVVSVAFAIRAGGINEDPKEKGISHFIEHMLYKGTPKRNSKQIAEQIENNGGELNGFTSEEVTAFWCKMPSKHINIALEVLADIIKNPLFDKKEFEKERKVIFEEIKMYHDNPALYVFYEIQELLYDGTMKINLAGTVETINSITREKIVKKFKELYQPNNMVFCVVGDADFDELVEFAEKNFGNQKAYVPKVKFNLINESKTEERKGVDQANLIFAYHVPLSNDTKNYAAIVLNSLMAGGMSSRLFDEIREKRNLAYVIKGDTNINKNFAYNIIYVGTMRNNVDKVKKLILEEFEKVSKEIESKEIEKIKEKLIGNYQISMEDSEEQMTNLLSSEIQGNAEDFYKFEENISKVKLEDVKELAKKATKKFSFFALVPK
jgi:predicted Zn-dependent peptidase